MFVLKNCLAPYETKWAQLLASLDRRAQTIREACGDSDSVNRVVEKIVDQLVSAWSQLRDPQLGFDEWPDKSMKDIEHFIESTTNTAFNTKQTYEKKNMDQV